ncbi:MAG TPA: hypothetical protein VJX66_31735, partial [Amycolatopsis sp.]|nr:hypothetical protein [Amycolatopsis sp.]
ILARAVLADPPVLLLDEPVEGLDPAHGDAVLARVLAAARGTVVLVTHRPEHLAGFDEILTLDNGHVERPRWHWVRQMHPMPHWGASPGPSESKGPLLSAGG